MIFNSLFLFIYIAYDPFMGVKLSFIFNSLCYFRMLLIMIIYKDSRPFWNIPNIKTLF